jgi:hypothetical protein
MHMRVPLTAIVRRIWTRCRTLAGTDCSGNADDADAGAVATPLPPWPPQDLDALLPASEKPEPATMPLDDTAAVQNPADAEQLIVQLMALMDGLLAVVEEEMQLVCAGRTDLPPQVEQTKADLARRYGAGIARLQRSRTYLRGMLPVSFAVLHHRHETFRALLQIKLTLLAVERAAPEVMVDDPSEASAEVRSVPHRPRTDRMRVPRSPQARRCPLPRRLHQFRHEARALPSARSLSTAS